MNIDSIIKKRKTQKVIAEEAWEIPEDESKIHELAAQLLEVAASAPYHHKCSSSFSAANRSLPSCLPYRFYALNTQSCRALASYISKEEINAGKVTNMLFAADLLFLVTWLPEPNPHLQANEQEPGEATPFAGSLKNMEHIAAASSAIQNVLIAATSRGIPNYWSSGGPLRRNPLREVLEIPLDEILLGALFFFPENSEAKKAQVMPGRLRDEGKELETWSRWIEID